MFPFCSVSSAAGVVGVFDLDLNGNGGVLIAGTGGGKV
jgi:hypothetical protein